LAFYYESIVKKIGGCKSLLLFSMVENIGVGLIYFSALSLSFYLMIFGRFLLGIGNFGVITAAFSCMKDWFPKNFG